ncbi:uncharacterized protein LOC119161892 isoform X1 [Rhipicephalus microplus]|uniref:uncharacterized protein LOC119161892 isoform X1 n=2 Tax=Rhipicephalus microplus TaxID=6941 RepID=UPI003F6D74D3
MERRGCQVLEDENAEAIASATPWACQTTGLQMPLSAPTHAEIYPVPRNGNQERHQSITAETRSTNAQRTQPPPRDPANQEKAHSSAALFLSNFRATLSITSIRKLLHHTYITLGKNLAGIRSRRKYPFRGRQSGSSPKVATCNESLDVNKATLRAAFSGCCTSVEQPDSSNDSFDSSSSGTEDEEKVRVGEVCGCYRALALTRRRAHEVDSSAATIVETGVRLTAIARRRTLMHRDQELIWVHAPRDLSVSMQKLCSFELTPAAKEAIIGAAYAPEDSHDLAEWETFTRALLSVHHCVYHLHLHISAVTRPPGHFYQSFSLQKGTALLRIEVSAFEDPSMDFMMPYLQYLCRIRNARMTSIYVERKCAPHPDDIPNDVYASVIVGDGLPELGDNRFFGLLDSTMYMPSLREISICVDNTGTGPPVPHQFVLHMTHIGDSQRCRLNYVVNENLQGLMHCKSDNTRQVSTAVATDRVLLLPTRHTFREPRRSGTHQESCIITLEQNSSPHYVIDVTSLVRMREDNELDSPNA